MVSWRINTELKDTFIAYLTLSQVPRRQSSAFLFVQSETIFIPRDLTLLSNEPRTCLRQLGQGGNIISRIIIINQLHRNDRQ